MPAPAVRGQDAAKLAARLQAADAASALDASDVKPWHLKMDVQLFDAKGKPTDQGTIEEWWSSPEMDRREYKTAAYTATEIRSGSKLYRTSGLDLPPYHLELLRWQVVHPIPPERGKAASFIPELRKLNAGKPSLDCIFLRSSSAQAPAVLGATPTYCMKADSDSLLMSLDFGSQEIVRGSIGRFQGKEVAVDAVVTVDNIKAATEHVESLVAEAAPESEFAVSVDTPEVVPAIVASGDPVTLDTLGSAVSQAQPVYPAQAKQEYLAGRVVLRAIIATDGSVRSIQVISSSNSIFETSAIGAVRQWKYKPSTMNGQPTEVETVIVLNFSFG